MQSVVREAVPFGHRDAGPEVRRLQQCARHHRVNVVIGVNERSATGIGTIYNTLLTIGAEGRVLGRHRKLVPTWAEKLTWANGDASSLRVHRTSIGPLGSLACGENTNTLARFSLLAQGELLHGRATSRCRYACRLRHGGGHQGAGDGPFLRGQGLHRGVLLGALEEIVDVISEAQPSARKLFDRNSSVLGHHRAGRPHVGEPLIDKEGIVYADIDLTRCIQPRQNHDITGHYNRFDIFDLRVNRRPQGPVRFDDADAAADWKSQLPMDAPDDETQEA